MGFLTLEHSKTAYCADFALHGWKSVEYALRRFLLHGVRPFRDRHALHPRQVPPAFYGVTTHFCEQVFGRAGPSNTRGSNLSWRRGVIRGSRPASAVD